MLLLEVLKNSILSIEKQKLRVITSNKIMKLLNIIAGQKDTLPFLVHVMFLPPDDQGIFIFRIVVMCALNLNLQQILKRVIGIGIEKEFEECISSNLVWIIIF